jgi:hypothetical protein
MRRNASRAIIVDAGRVTATARADIGASRVRRKAWVRGCIQMCDDDRLRAAISIGSLLCIRALGTRLAWRFPWLSRVIEGAISCRCCILMLPASMWVRASCSLLSAPTATCSQSAGSPLLRKTYMRLPIGSSSAESDPWRWSQPAFTGFRFYQILEARGLEVCLVNAQHVKNVPGRKTDVSDCQWLQYLHSVGLLRASFRPPGAICAVRSLAAPRQPGPDGS